MKTVKSSRKAGRNGKPRSNWKASRNSEPELEYLFDFDAIWWHEHRTLLTDGKGNLFCAGKDSAPEPERVTVKDALAWYARCFPWTDGSGGDLQTLCALAAKEIERLERLTGAAA